MLVNFMTIMKEYISAIRYTLWPIDNLVIIWYICPHVGTFYQKNLATLFWSSFLCLQMPDGLAESICLCDKNRNYRGLLLPVRHFFGGKK
jgi:hypothetical protein